MKCVNCGKFYTSEDFMKEKIVTMDFDGFVPKYWLKVKNKTYVFCGYECCNRYYLENLKNIENNRNTKTKSGK